MKHSILFYFLIFIYFIITPLCMAGETASTEITVKEITPEDAYIQAVRVRDEIEILKHHFGITKVTQVNRIEAPFSQRHTWQKTYEILFKISILREKYGLPFIAASSRQPLLEVKSLIVYEQLLRILTEIALIKIHLGISEASLPLETISSIEVKDTFNLLNHVSYQIDLLTGTSFTPSYPFSQAMRISDDVNIILDALEIKDTTIPPPKLDAAVPANAYAAGLRVLLEVNRIERMMNLQEIDTQIFNIQGTITPTDVFSLAGIILAELQPIKAYLGLRYEMTPVARHYEGRQPKDVQQLLGWVTRKLQLIQSINTIK